MASRTPQEVDLLLEPAEDATVDTWHWSRVAVGSSFDAVVAFDPSVYAKGHVRVPFLRTADGFVKCMETTKPWSTKEGGDSRWHTHRWIKSNFRPLLHDDFGTTTTSLRVALAVH